MGDDAVEVRCHVCGHDGATNGGDGHFYCDLCGSQAEDIVETAIDEDDHAIYTGNALRRRTAPAAIKAEPLSQVRTQSQFWDRLGTLDDDRNRGSNGVKIEDWQDGIWPTEPQDFGQRWWSEKEEDYLRMSYVMGLQIMIELQTKALVEEFNVSPLICGLAGTVWLRYVASTGVFDDHWANGVISESESQREGFRENFKPRAKPSESLNIHGQRAVMLWYRSLSKRIPLSHTLVITYLVCHLAREEVLPTDILKWSLEGKLPYFTAFMDIEKMYSQKTDGEREFGAPSEFCPLSCSFMFRPSESISLYKLESQAASIAQKIGLELPPVNFYAIASRYLKKLSLNIGKILPSVCKLYEWSMPAELWLSANEMRLPTRVCVLSMVIVAIRILYNIHGFGYWEKSFSIDLSSGKSLEGLANTADASTADSSEKSGDVEESELEAMQLLRHLEEQYDELEDTYEYTKDLPTYLKYCKDVVFAGMGPSYKDPEEENLIEHLWKIYQEKKDSLPSNNHDFNGISTSKRSRDNDVMNPAKGNKRNRDNDSKKSSHTDDSSPKSMSVDGDPSQQSMSVVDCPTSDGVSEKDKAMKRLRLNMNDSRFCYIPPRVKVKRRDYLQYVRKKDEGVYTYAAHADYYILLRSCARIAKVDARVIHCGVLSFERRLGWLEKRIDDCLSQLEPKEQTCKQCDEEMKCDVREDPVGISRLNI